MCRPASTKFLELIASLAEFISPDVLVRVLVRRRVALAAAEAAPDTAPSAAENRPLASWFGLNFSTGARLKRATRAPSWHGRSTPEISVIVNSSRILLFIGIWHSFE